MRKIPIRKLDQEQVAKIESAIAEYVSRRFGIGVFSNADETQFRANADVMIHVTVRAEDSDMPFHWR